VTLERRYGLSTQSVARWWFDRVKSGVIGAVFVILAGLIVAYLRRWLPETWWIAAAIIFAMLLVGLARVAPVLLMPLFHEFKPLDRPALVERLVTLARRADADVMGVFEWRLSDRTRKANAALTGIGKTRRILLSDTLLAEHPDDEVEVILAHELAHHLHRDIWTGLALEGALLTAGFYAAHRTLASVGPWLGLGGASDVAALPVVALSAGTVALALTPITHAVSRAHERRADRFALELTGNAGAFMSAMRRLSARNLAEEHPSGLVVWLFHSHPSTSARIAAATAWAARRLPRRSGVSG
jgi:STE24 endopeptidase